MACVAKHLFLNWVDDAIASLTILRNMLCSFIYNFADLVVMTIHYKHIGEAFYFFHHGASMYAYYYVMVSKV